MGLISIRKTCIVVPLGILLLHCSLLLLSPPPLPLSPPLVAAEDDDLLLDFDFDSDLGFYKEPISRSYSALLGFIFFTGTIVQIRTVLAYVGESRALQAYASALKFSQRLGYKTGFAKGSGLGATYFTVFCCYALLLWYGGYLVRHHYTKGGLASCHCNNVLCYAWWTVSTLFQ